MKLQKPTVLFGRQPILNDANNIIGFELLYRSASNLHDINDIKSPTAVVVNNALHATGLKSLVDNKLAFINVDEGFLEHDMVELLPKEGVVMELQPNIVLTSELLQRLEFLHSCGYKFSSCIDQLDTSRMKIIERLMPVVDFIKVNVLEVGLVELFKMMLVLGASQKKLIASHIENMQEYETLKAAGFQYFQGFYFAHPEMVQGKKFDTNEFSIIELCNLLSQDASTKELAKAFEKVPEITIKLIAYLNSAEYAFQASVDSIHRMIATIGRKPLRQWLFLTLYANSNSCTNISDCPSLVTVKQRCSLMCELLESVGTKNQGVTSSQAVFVGLISMMDTLFQVPMDVMLEHFYVDDIISEALLNYEGFLGELYETTLAIETFDVGKIELFMNNHNIKLQNFEQYLMIGFENSLK